jgi:hypothetical protein
LQKRFKGERRDGRCIKGEESNIQFQTPLNIEIFIMIFNTRAPAVGSFILLWNIISHDIGEKI